KRFLVLHGPERRTHQTMTRKAVRRSLIVEVLRRQAALNARLFASDRAALLTGPADVLDDGLKTAGFTQSQRALVLGVSQSAVSRREAYRSKNNKRRLVTHAQKNR